MFLLLFIANFIELGVDTSRNVAGFPRELLIYYTARFEKIEKIVGYIDFPPTKTRKKCKSHAERFIEVSFASVPILCQIPLFRTDVDERFSEFHEFSDNFCAELR